jgi:hypothetical protein
MSNEDLGRDIDYIERCDRYVRLDFWLISAKHDPTGTFRKKNNGRKEEAARWMNCPRVFRGRKS